MSSSYQYSPLSPGCQTRILELLPSQSKAAPIHARLQDIDIYKHYDFKALSYTWGAPSFTERIVLEDRARKQSVLMITPNLRDALVRFRDGRQIVRIWVDALCINQKDEAEKAKQIPFMDKIYRTATKVLVWLGKYHNEAASIEFLNSASRRLESQDIRKVVYPHVQKVVRLPWFTRRWIVQEIVLNVHVDLFCGESASIPWFRLAETIFYIKRALGPLEDLRSVEMMAILTEAHRARTNDKPIPHTGILDVLTSFSDLGCFDARDRIYALAGLASDLSLFQPDNKRHDGWGANLQVDYKKSVEQVYTELMAKNIKEFEGFHRVLQIASQRSNGGHLSNKSSWVPDWRLQPVRYNLSDDKEVPGLDLTTAQVDVKENSHILQARFRPEGESTGYTPYALIERFSDPLPTNTSNENLAIWVRNTWKFLLKHVALTPGINMNDPSTASRLLTQYERLLLERSNSVKHSGGANNYDYFPNSSEFIHILNPSAKWPNGARHNAALEAEMFAAIRKTMQGRRIFLGKGSRPLTRKNKLSGMFSSGDKPSDVHWPAIGVAADYATAGDVVYTRSVMLRGWHIVGTDGSVGTNGHGYFESQRSGTFILRPLPAGGLNQRKGMTHNDKSVVEINKGLSNLDMAGQQEQRSKEFFYIGECKTTRLLEVKPKDGKLDTRKLTGEVNQGRVRADTILIR